MGRLRLAPPLMEVYEDDVAPRPLVPAVTDRMLRSRFAKTATFLALMVGAFSVAMGNSMALLGAPRTAMLGAAGGSRRVRFEVGSFTKQVGTGNQDISISTNGTGFASGSWALVFWASQYDIGASGTFTTHAEPMLGFAANGGGSISQYAVGAASADANNPSNSGRTMSASCIAFAWLNANASSRATFTSFVDSTHIRINWAEDGGVVGPKINYMLISGLTAAKVVAWTIPTSVTTGTVTVSGVDLSTNGLLLHASAMDTGAPLANQVHADLAFGFTNTALEQCGGSFAIQDATTPSNTARYQLSNRALPMTSDSGSEIDRTQVTSMNNGSFGISQNVASGSARYVATLCMSGVQSKIGTFTKTTSAAPVSQNIETGLAFTPKASLVAMMNQASTGPNTHACLGFAGYDGTNARAAGFRDTDNKTTTEAQAVWVSGKGALDVGSSGSTVTSQGDVTLGTTTSINWTTNDANAILGMHCLIG